MAARVPTYVTLKDVKKRWGHGQEDVYPVAQFEKLWGDMTGLTECANVFAAVPRHRGQQLKDQAQLDSWARDGSAAGIAGPSRSASSTRRRAVSVRASSCHRLPMKLSSWLSSTVDVYRTTTNCCVGKDVKDVTYFKAHTAVE